MTDVVMDMDKETWEQWIAAGNAVTDETPLLSDVPKAGHRPRYWTPERIVEAIQSFAEEHGRPPVANEWKRAAPDHPGQSTISQTFGSWAAAIVEAGFPRPVRGGYRKPLDSAGDPGSATPAESSGPGVDEPVVTGSAAPPPSAPHDADAGSPGELGEALRFASADARTPGPLVVPADPGGASASLTARRDPIRTADIPYDAGLLENEAAFLRARAEVLLDMASALRKLDALSTVTIRQAP